MSRRRSKYDKKYYVGGPLTDLFSNVALGVIMTSVFGIGIVSWILLLALTGSDTRTAMLIVLSVISAILLVGQMLCICFIGYDGFARTLWVAWVAGIVMAIIGFYIGGVHMMPLAEGQSTLLRMILELIFYIPAAAFLMIVPVVMINIVIWLIMSIFGKS